MPAAPACASRRSPRDPASDAPCHRTGSQPRSPGRSGSAGCGAGGGRRAVASPPDLSPQTPSCRRAPMSWARHRGATQPPGPTPEPSVRGARGAPRPSRPPPGPRAAPAPCCRPLPPSCISGPDLREGRGPAHGATCPGQACPPAPHAPGASRAQRGHTHVHTPARRGPGAASEPPSRPPGPAGGRGVTGSWLSINQCHVLPPAAMASERRPGLGGPLDAGPGDGRDERDWPR